LKIVTRSKRTPHVLDAIHQALATFATLRDSPEAEDLRRECLAIEETAKEWARVPPSPEDRDAMKRKVLAIHVALTRLGRRSERPK
jgi:hypothetical protein